MCFYLYSIFVPVVIFISYYYHIPCHICSRPSAGNIGDNVWCIECIEKGVIIFNHTARRNRNSTAIIALLLRVLKIFNKYYRHRGKRFGMHQAVTNFSNKPERALRADHEARQVERRCAVANIPQRVA